MSRVNSWNRDEDAFLIANPAMQAVDIADRLGRTRSAVQNRRHILKRSGVLERKRYGDNDSPFKCGSRPMLAKTCPDCGLLLQAKWFMQDGQRKAWSRFCRRCATAKSEAPARNRETRWNRAKESAEAYQRLTLPGATNHNKPWLEDDMEVLSDPDLTRLQKALALKRTYHSVNNAVKAFGFPSKVGLGDPERDQWIIDNPNVSRLDDINAWMVSEMLIPELEPAGAPRRPDFDWED